MTAKELSERAHRVHKEAIIIDMLEAVFAAKEDWSPKEIEYFKTLVDAGVTAIGATIPYVSDDLPAAIKKIAKFYKALESVKNAKVAFTAADIESAKKEGKVAIMLGMQDSVPFERDLDLVRVFDKLGVKSMQIAYYRQNYLGAGCAESVDHGLTNQGREAIKELNRLGVLIDTSHCGDKTARDAAEVSKDPIAITHTTPATLVEIPRARSDETIKAVADKGGVIGLVMHAMFNERKDKMGVRPTLSNYVDNIDYLVGLVGGDHVGFGLDLVPFWTKSAYDGYFSVYGTMFLPHIIPAFEQKYCEGFDSVSDTVKLTEELLRRGYSDDDTKKIVGGNWLRLIKEVWK